MSQVYAFMAVGWLALSYIGFLLPRRQKIMDKNLFRFFFVCTVLHANFQVCPVAGLLGNKVDWITSREFQQFTGLAFLSIKHTILINR